MKIEFDENEANALAYLIDKAMRFGGLETLKAVNIWVSKLEKAKLETVNETDTEHS